MAAGVALRCWPGISARLAETGVHIETRPRAWGVAEYMAPYEETALPKGAAPEGAAGGADAGGGVHVAEGVAASVGRGVIVGTPPP